MQKLKPTRQKNAQPSSYLVEAEG